MTEEIILHSKNRLRMVHFRPEINEKRVFLRQACLKKGNLSSTIHEKRHVGFTLRK
jgi:hypothetical protein